MVHYNLTCYADIPRLVSDKAYAKSKNLLVKKQNDIFIIKYDKYHLNPDNLQSLGLFRSVITDGNKLLAFSPPKSIPIKDFTDKFPISETIFEEFVEGTMINCFNHNNEWQIATRWNIGANNAFYQDNYRSLSFHDMFVEAMQQCQLHFEDMNVNYCYSFVLQHPNNRIVVPFSKPHLVLIAIYENGTAENPWQVSKMPLLMRGRTDEVGWAGEYPARSTENFQENIKPFISADTPYTTLGIMLIHKDTGIRSKVRNPIYEKVRNLKGNSPKIQYQYYNLYKEGRVKEFLKFYPEYKNTFWDYRSELLQWTQNLWELYKDVYIHKKKTQQEIPYAFRPHIWALHDIYIQELREKNLIITKRIVVDYIKNIPAARLMYSINYPLRQKQKDDVKGMLEVN